MPYIITTTHGERDMRWPRVTRRAVATLDEAREVAWQAAREHGADADTRRAHGGLKQATGGTIGPLPDGTVIEVTAVGWWRLGEQSGLPSYPAIDAYAKIIAAYNAAQGVTA